MGLFGKKTGGEPRNMGALNDVQMQLGAAAYQGGDYAKAFSCFKLVAENSQRAEAQYNLASLYARGLGVARDYRQAAYWYERARRNGDGEAGKYATKCLMDYVVNDLAASEPREIYAQVRAFVDAVFEPGDGGKTACGKLRDLGLHECNNKKEYALAAKLFRAGAEFGGDGLCQNYLAVLYNAGLGVKKSDLAALYWFDRAAEQGVEPAKTDRDGILRAYVDNLGLQEARSQIALLARWCGTGEDAGVPLDEERAKYWRGRALTLA